MVKYDVNLVEHLKSLRGASLSQQDVSVKSENRKPKKCVKREDRSCRNLKGFCGGKVGPGCECQKWCRPHLSTAQTGYKALSGIFIFIGLREGIKKRILIDRQGGRGGVTLTVSPTIKYTLLFFDAFPYIFNI